MQVDIKALERDVAEYREQYEKKTKDFDELVMKNEEQMKEVKQLPVTHSTDKVELQDAMKSLQAAVGEFKTSCQEISSYSVHTVRSYASLC